MDTNTIKIASYIGGGVVVGGLAGVFLTRDHYKAKFRAVAEEEIESVKEAFRRQNKEGVYATPESAAEALIPESERSSLVTGPQGDPALLVRQVEIIKEQGYVMVEGERFETGGDEDVEDKDEDTGSSNEQQVHSIFDGTNLPPRVAGRPFVISVEEYMTDDEYMKVNLAYYDEDGVLADDRDSIVPNIMSVIGDATEHFGTGSGDPMIVYVKNERLKTIFEVVKDEQSYAKLILKIQETEERPIRRRLRDDE